MCDNGAGGAVPSTDHLGGFLGGFATDDRGDRAGAARKVKHPRLRRRQRRQGLEQGTSHHIETPARKEARVCHPPARISVVAAGSTSSTTTRQVTHLRITRSSAIFSADLPLIAEAGSCNDARPRQPDAPPRPSAIFSAESARKQPRTTAPSPAATRVHRAYSGGSRDAQPSMPAVVVGGCQTRPTTTTTTHNSKNLRRCCRRSRAVRSAGGLKPRRPRPSLPHRPQRTYESMPRSPAEIGRRDHPPRSHHGQRSTAARIGAPASAAAPTAADGHAAAPSPLPANRRHTTGTSPASVSLGPRNSPRNSPASSTAEPRGTADPSVDFAAEFADHGHRVARSSAGAALRRAARALVA